MKERPILFSTPMVEATLDGRKKQTRRIVKPQPLQHFRKDDSVIIYERTPGNWEVKDKNSNDSFSRLDSFKCPYGVVGDILWVRETFSFAPLTKESKEHYPELSEYIYKAGSKFVNVKWKPAIHMPKKAARIWLQITDVRVERLHDISEQDAEKEGIETKRYYSPDSNFCTRDYLSKPHEDGFWSGFCVNDGKQFRTSFESLWKSINGNDSWESNPWVWVVEFKRIEKPVFSIKKVMQTRFHDPGKVAGNCFAAVVASFMDRDSAEDVIQIQESMGDPDWVDEFDNWLYGEGYEWENIPGHLYDGRFYMVIGKTSRFPNVNHVCIYQNGKLYHDPHPEGTGLITEEIFEIITKIK